MNISLKPGLARDGSSQVRQSHLSQEQCHVQTRQPLAIKLQRMNGFPSWVCPLSLLQDSEKLSQVSSMVYMGYYISHRSSLSVSLPEDTSSFRPIYKGASTAFCIQLFCIDEKYEARQVPVPSLSAMERASSGLARPILSSHRVRGFQAWLPVLISGEFFFKTTDS